MGLVDANLEPFDPVEVKELISKYGQARMQTFDLDIDAELYATRKTKLGDRRGEVVFAIRGPQSGIYLHRKRFWDKDLIRLPSGGIYPNEKVINALHRELREETGLEACEVRLVGIQDCRMHYHEDSLRFVSYVFYLPKTNGKWCFGEGEDIVEFVEIPPKHLAEVADRLRRVAPPYAAWGRWRALAHDLMHEYLAGLEP